jgi:hypothetical protein
VAPVLRGRLGAKEKRRASRLSAASRLAGIELDARGRRVVAGLEIPMLVISLLVIPGLLLDSAATQEHDLHVVALALDWVIWLGFLIEFVTMLWVGG